MERKVWVTKESMDRDISSAARFGTIVPPIFDRHVSPHDVKRQQEVIRESVFPVAKKEDLILTVGPMIMVVTLASMWAREFGEVRCLVWDVRSGQYVEKYVEPW